MGDASTIICLQAGRELADPRIYPRLPANSLPDQAARIKLVTEVENPIQRTIDTALAEVGPIPEAVELIVQALHLVAQAVQLVVPLMRANTQLNSLAEAKLAGQPTHVALGMAMRYYAGFLDVAKSLREKTGQGVVIDDAMRAAEANAILNRASDEIYDAGARFGWWGNKRPDRPDAGVFINGLSESFKQRYLAEYYQQYPPIRPTSGKQS